MHSDRWPTISPLLDELLELDGDARAARLAQIKSDDPELAAELRKLMALENEHPDFLTQPIVNAAFFSPQPGQEIGPYRLISPIGEGGMGQVWLAMRSDGLYERQVALKLLRPGLADVGLHARFTRERQILARLGHAHIARLLDAGISQDGQPYLALDYVQGEPITVYAQQHAMDIRGRLQLFAQVCAAVSHAHSNLVVHRDLKPSNILVTPAGEVCLLDFGIAKLLDQDNDQHPEITRTGSRTFTLHYAAPEQLRGELITTMTDVYSLGIVLYELLTECKPYELARQTDAAWEEAILSAEPVRPSQAAARAARTSGQAASQRRARLLVGDLDNIVLKSLSKRPDQRYPSVEALAQDLRRHLDGQPVLARAQSMNYRIRKYLRRHALAIGLVGGITGVLAIALATVSWQAHKALQEAARAQAMQDFVIALFENTGTASNAQSLDVRNLLDAGIRRADHELAAQPQARAELIGLIARLRSGLGDDREALQLLDRQQQLIHILDPDAPASLALDSAALRGRSLRELGRSQDCLHALGPLLGNAQAAADAYPMETAEYFSQLGRCHRQLHHSELARKLFEQALQLRRNTLGNPVLEAESQTDLALLLLDDRQNQQAIAALRDALERLHNNGGERNALGVDIWRGLGLAYLQQNHLQESEAAYRQALDIALSRFGARHPRTTLVQQGLAELLIRIGKLEEAARLLDYVQDSMAARWGRESVQWAAIQSVRGALALERADAAEAASALAGAIRVWRTLPRFSDDQALDLCRLAQAKNNLGQFKQVTAAGRECVSRLQATATASTAIALAIMANIALDHDNLTSANTWLAQATDALSADQNLAQVRARVAVMSGDPTASEQIAALLKQLPSSVSGQERRWQLQALQAALACRDGQMESGLQLREQSLNEAASAEPERQDLARQLETWSAACIKDQRASNK